MLEAKCVKIPTAPNDRIAMLQNITPGQLDSIGEITRRIYDQKFPLLVQDLGYFDDRSLVVRFLFADRVSFRRKKATKDTKEGPLLL